VGVRFRGRVRNYTTGSSRVAQLAVQVVSPFELGLGFGVGVGVEEGVRVG
jgi:hypothetical protein